MPLIRTGPQVAPRVLVGGAYAPSNAQLEWDMVAQRVQIGGADEGAFFGGDITGRVNNLINCLYPKLKNLESSPLTYSPQATGMICPIPGVGSGVQLGNGYLHGLNWCFALTCCEVAGIHSEIDTGPFFLTPSNLIVKLTYMIRFVVYRMKDYLYYQRSPDFGSAPSNQVGYEWVSQGPNVIIGATSNVGVSAKIYEFANSGFQDPGPFTAFLKSFNAYTADRSLSGPPQQGGETILSNITWSPVSISAFNALPTILSVASPAAGSCASSSASSVVDLTPYVNGNDEIGVMVGVSDQAPIWPTVPSPFIGIDSSQVASGGLGAITWTMQPPDYKWVLEDPWEPVSSSNQPVNNDPRRDICVLPKSDKVELGTAEVYSQTPLAATNVSDGVVAVAHGVWVGGANRIAVSLVQETGSEPLVLDREIVNSFEVPNLSAVAIAASGDSVLIATYDNAYGSNGDLRLVLFRVSGGSLTILDTVTIAYGYQDKTLSVGFVPGTKRFVVAYPSFATYTTLVGSVSSGSIVYTAVGNPSSPYSLSVVGFQFPSLVMLDEAGTFVVAYMGWDGWNETDLVAGRAVSDTQIVWGAPIDQPDGTESAYSGNGQRSMSRLSGDSALFVYPASEQNENYLYKPFNQAFGVKPGVSSSCWPAITSGAVTWSDAQIRALKVNVANDLTISFGRPHVVYGLTDAYSDVKTCPVSDGAVGVVFKDVYRQQTWSGTVVYSDTDSASGLSSGRVGTTLVETFSYFMDGAIASWSGDNRVAFFGSSGSYVNEFEGVPVGYPGDCAYWPIKATTAFGVGLWDLTLSCYTRGAAIPLDLILRVDERPAIPIRVEGEGPVVTTTYRTEEPLNRATTIDAEGLDVRSAPDQH